MRLARRLSGDMIAPNSHTLPIAPCSLALRIEMLMVTTRYYWATSGGCVARVATARGLVRERGGSVGAEATAP